MLTMVGTPLSVLAAHAKCDAQHHSCDETVADVCCCGHVTGTESQQPAANNPIAVNVPVATPPVASVVPVPPWLPDRHELVPHVNHFVIDRLVLFRVLLI
jgi:hypothetical protein